MKIKIGVLGTADIAFRRFLPSLQKSEYFEYAGIASRDYAKTGRFIECFGGKGYNSYHEMISDNEIQALYIPLPPALHYDWGLAALNSGKHILLEKPFTTEFYKTNEIVRTAQKNNLAVHENYMFIFHSQLKHIMKIIDEGTLGQIRLYRMTFGFPMRAADDFRYNKNLGGGALFDCGGYPLKLATHFLGDTTSVKTSKLHHVTGIDVDLYGSATLENNDGQVAQISFGMDNDYRCELEIWGSKGSLLASRIFTAGPDINPEVILKVNGIENRIRLQSDDQFLNSINEFYSCIQDNHKSAASYQNILIQSTLMEEIYQGNKRGIIEKR